MRGGFVASMACLKHHKERVMSRKCIVVDTVAAYLFWPYSAGVSPRSQSVRPAHMRIDRGLRRKVSWRVYFYYGVLRASSIMEVCEMAFE